MSDHKQFTHRQLKMSGPAELFAYDEIHDWYIPLGKIDNIRTRRETDVISQSEVHFSRSVRIDGLASGERWFASGSIMEPLNPDMQRLVFKNCGQPTHSTDCILLSVTEGIRMFRREAKILSGNNGFFTDLALPAPANVTAVPAGGGTIPNGTYVIVVEAVYTDAQGFNPVRSAHAESAGAILAVQSLVVAWDPPATGTPDHYNIYEYDTAAAETRVDADLVGVVLGTSPTNIIFTEFVDLGDWPGDTAGVAFTVTDVTGGTTFAVGTDYTIDTSCARLALVDGGTIEDGESLLVTYVYLSNPFYYQSIGPGSRNPRILHLVIRWFKDDERIEPVGRGAEIHFPHVLAESGFEWLFDQMDFESGWDQEWPIYLDTATGRYGVIYTFHKIMESWGLIELQALSAYSGEPICPLGTS